MRPDTAESVASVLDYLASDESLLLAFAADGCIGWELAGAGREREEP